MPSQRYSGFKDLLKTREAMFGVFSNLASFAFRTPDCHISMRICFSSHAAVVVLASGIRFLKM